MSDGVVFDSTEIHALAAELTSAAAGIASRVRPVVLKGALNIQRDARQRVSGHKTLGAYPFSITTDLGFEEGAIVGEVGPDKSKRQGPLGNLIEYGTGTMHAPIPHLEPALDAETPRFEENVAIVAAII